jgi:hypothetical protein
MEVRPKAMTFGRIENFPQGLKYGCGTRGGRCACAGLQLRSCLSWFQHRLEMRAYRADLFIRAVAADELKPCLQMRAS